MVNILRHTVYLKYMYCHTFLILNTTTSKIDQRWFFTRFYTPVFRRDVLWYGDFRPSRVSVRPSDRLSVRVSVRPFSALFSYML